jgi:hypothetical protein
MNIAAVNVGLAAVCIACSWRNPGKLGLIATAFALQLAHAMLFDGYPDAFAYYGGAAMCDAAILLVASAVRQTRFARDLQWIQALAIITHLCGFIGYWNRAPVLIYTDTIRALLTIQTIRMIWPERGNASGRLSRTDRWHRVVRGADSRRPTHTAGGES